MMINPTPEILAQEFWAGTGLDSTFPRELERALALKLPLALVKLPLLSMAVVRSWLERRRISVPFPSGQEDLCGCLVAYREHGIIFVCGADEAAEQRFTLAHEVAHFLRDYLWPRQQIVQKLGENMREVLDGLRPATSAERAAAILSSVRLGAHIHLLPRFGTDEEGDAVVMQIEERADALALELVAPHRRIGAFLQERASHTPSSLEDTCAALAAYFVLPAYAFTAIVRDICRQPSVSFLADITGTVRRAREEHCVRIQREDSHADTED